MMTAPKQPMLRGELRLNEPLKRYNTWRVGGSARQMYLPADADDLAVFLDSLPPQEPLLWLGLGSNLLIRDGGFPGTVIMLLGRLNSLSIEGDEVRVDAGVSCAKVARECARANLTGAAFLAGIPGTMGGALAMNAGAFGGETWRHVISVETIDRKGNRHKRNADEYQVGYRSVSGPADEWFTAAIFQFEQGDGSAASAGIKQLLARRAETQPMGAASCGSVFTNPENDHAARLIESCGLKGYRIGGAVVSEKHANFIINDNNASANDIESLIKYVQQTVLDQQGVELTTEVQIVGAVA